MWDNDIKLCIYNPSLSDTKHILHTSSKRTDLEPPHLNSTPVSPLKLHNVITKSYCRRHECNDQKQRVFCFVLANRTVTIITFVKREAFPPRIGWAGMEFYSKTSLI